MEFSFTEEQQMICDTAEAFLADVSNSQAIRQVMETETGYSHELWNRICSELYLQAITIPEELGGMGLGFVELVAVMEQMGRYLLCAPYFSTVCLASTALLVSGNEEQQATYLGGVLEGKTGTLAYHGGGLTQGLDAVTATYEISADNIVLNGEYHFVVDGHTAEFLVVAAKNTQGGLGLFVLDSDADGIARQWTPTMDQTRKQAKITLTNVIALPLNNLGTAEVDFNKILQLATVTLAAEQAGGAAQVLDLTVAYTKERVQFNRPVASFQAVKHQAADMMLRAEASRSAIYYAACVAQDALDNGELADELNEAASIAKAYASEAYFKNAGDAIQLHGGVGFTWEYDVHLYFKRAKASEHMLGAGNSHRENIASILLDS